MDSSEGESLVIDIGRYVECDWCGTVLTDDTRTGGLMFQSKAVGPCCLAKVEALVEQYGEQRFVRGRCTPGMAFADWVRELRAQTPLGNEIHIISGPDAVNRALDLLSGD